MPILIPIQDAPTAGVTIGGVLSGATDLTGNLSVRPGLHGFLFSSTAISGTLGVKHPLAGSLNGNTSLSGFLRVNAEANIFLAGSLEGSTELTGDIGVGGAFRGQLLGATNITGNLTVSHAEEAVVTIFIDILDAAIVAAQNANIRLYNARLVVNGVEIPIRTATLEARRDSLGTELRATLARADTSQVGFSDAVNFDLGIWTGGAWTWLPLITGGKLSSIENPIKNENGAPADEVSISIVDVIADRWNRAPRTPIHLYDANQLEAPDQSQLANNRIELQAGGVILPVNTPIPDLTLMDVLEAAYVDDVGFAEVITNIPDFPVAEADFTLDGGYDGGVRPLLQLFAPLLFERNNVLFVIDPDGPLPAGFTARSFPQSLTRELTDAVPQREPVNAILLRLKGGVSGDFFTERIDSSTSSSGQFGTPNWTETAVAKRVREYRTFANPTTIVREEVISEQTTVVDWLFNPIEVTTLTQTYDTLARKTGHQRRVAKLLPDINNDGAMTLLDDVTVQNQGITYRPNPMNPAQDVQDTVNTVESGLILVDAGNQYLEAPYRIPLTDAHVSGYVDPQGEQSVIQGDIRTTTEALRVRGQQVDVETRVINHLANSPVQTSITTRPGAVAMDRSRGAATRTLLITTPGTDALGRRAQTFDAGLLPSEIAIELGQRKLRRLNSPPKQISLSPAFPDVSIKRGSLLEIEARGEVLGTYLVEGYSISFSAPGVASMSVTAREIKD